VRRAVLLKLFLVSLILANSDHVALGDVVRFAFSGSLSVYDPFDLLPPGVASANEYTGVLTYDTNTPDIAQQGENVGVYPAPSASPFELTIQIGASSFGGSGSYSGSVYVGNDLPVDELSILPAGDSLQASWGGGPQDALDSQIHLLLSDAWADSFGNDHLPDVIVPGSFDFGELQFSGGQFFGTRESPMKVFIVTGTVNLSSLTLLEPSASIPVPEPSTSVICVCAVAVIAMLRGRFSSRYRQ
jgi:hypothetical protein